MDGFITLIILVVVFNLLSAVMRAIKGGSAQTRSSRQPVQKPPPAFNLDAEELFPFAVKREFSEPEEQEYEAEPEREFDKEAEEELDDDQYYSDYTDYEDEPKELQEEPVTVLPQQVRPAAMPGKPEAAVTPGIRTVLTEKNSFLAAFILHEILDLPPSLRRMKRL